MATHKLTFAHAHLAADQEERVQFMDERNVLMWQVCSLECALLRMHTSLSQPLVLF